MRHITDAGLDLLKQHEGLRLGVYRDSAGLPTVGYGHLIRKGERFTKGVTEDEATELLRKDVGTAERAVARNIRVPLTDGQFDALVIFTFNIGGGAFQRSTLRAKCNREEHGSVPAEFLRWVYAGGRRIEGLARRRRATAKMYAAATLHFDG